MILMLTCNHTSQRRRRRRKKNGGSRNATTARSILECGRHVVFGKGGVPTRSTNGICRRRSKSIPSGKHHHRGYCRFSPAAPCLSTGQKLKQMNTFDTERRWKGCGVYSKEIGWKNDGCQPQKKDMMCITITALQPQKSDLFCPDSRVVSKESLVMSQKPILVS
jgi:hypothetical protein